jgi:hypothetical protein
MDLGVPKDKRGLGSMAISGIETEGTDHVKSLCKGYVRGYTPIYIVYSTTVLPFQDPGTLEFPWDVTEVT